MKTLITIIALLTFSIQSMAQSGRYQNQRNRNAVKQRNAAQQKKVQMKQTYGGRRNGTIYGNTVIQNDANYFSADGAYFFKFQTDGNLVIYRTYDERSIWSSQSTGRGAVKCEFQVDGNLVISDANGGIIWDAFTDQQHKTNRVVESSASKRARGKNKALIMQNDGNLVIYSGLSQAVKWASGSQQ